MTAAEAAAAMRAVRSTWDEATLDGGAACGLPVAVAAFQQMQEAWFTELGAYADVLDALAGPAAEIRPAAGTGAGEASDGQ